MKYLELLQKSFKDAGNCACVGLDIVPDYLPVGVTVDQFIEAFLTKMHTERLVPAAFKPNIAYFSALNVGYECNFSGYESLAKCLKLIRKLFPSVPIILDAKRGDIAISSLKYAEEVFDSWKVDATTVSPYMGHDSILPFRDGFESKGVYVLNRTSNLGAVDLQNLTFQSGQLLYEKVAEQIASYAKQFSGIGAVVGATSLDELQTLAKFYARRGSVPLLIPGVGSQGGSATEVITSLKKANYDMCLVRINSSSGLTFPWKKEKKAPVNWLKVCMEKVKSFLNKTSMLGEKTCKSLI